MRIDGFQKLTLLDYPGKVACTLFTAGCDFRCPFCHNADLVLPGQAPGAIDEGEILDLLQKRRGVLDGVCVTGGEPLLHADLAPFLRKIKELGYAIKLDTNGAFPDHLRALVGAGLVDYVAMDIKNSPERYAGTAGVPGLDLRPIRASVDYLMSGAVPFEFRTTVTREFHDADAFRAIGAWIAGDEAYFLQQFQDSGNLLQEGLHPFSEGEMAEFKSILQDFVPKVELRGL